MTTRTVTFVGNCQALAMCNLYRDFVGNPRGETVLYYNDHDIKPERVRAEVAGADCVIVQDRDFNHGLTADQLPPGTELHAFPMVLAGFIWPFANEPHVHNVAQPPFSDGPYPSQLSDGYLNRLITKGVAPEAALAESLALDVGRVAHIDRMTELYLERQRERDARTGYDIAPVIEAEYRRQPLFRTPNHPNAMLFGVVAQQFLTRLGIADDIVAVAVRSLEKSPFPSEELPIHPAVIRHLGLDYANNTTRYTYFDEGSFTFEEFVLRYMRYESNHALRTAIATVDSDDPAANIARLEEGLAQSPASVRGWRCLGLLLDRVGRQDAALPAYERSIALDPTDPEGHVALARALLSRGRIADAEAAAASAVAAAPRYAVSHMTMAEVLHRAGRPGDAVAHAREAVRLIPGRASFHNLLGIVLMLSGDADGAERAATIAMAMEPASPDHRNLVAEIYELQGRRAEAIALLGGGPRNSQSYSLLGNFHLRNGDLAEADAAFAEGAAMDPGRPDLAECLADVRARRVRDGV